MSTAQSSAQDSRSSASERRRKRKERSAKSRVPEPKNIVSGAGQPLDLSVRRELEEQLGHDFSQVRLHTDRDSGRLADMMGADAFAVGQDIFFREGTYRPGTADGQRLLAHELLHTIQNPHGLGALRAGRDLGSVSLPQESIEREAESAARASVLGALRDSVRVEEPAAEIVPGQATPGWLRYATVDAGRRRMEHLDPATLVDRLANGVLRSLRGDPEDLSGRVRLQLARLAPEVQETVLDRLEVRLSTPELDRLLELVEEMAEGPLPLESATAPEPVPDEAGVIEEERARAAAAARDRRKGDEKESDGRRKRAQQRKDADPAGDGGPERGGQPAAGGAGKGSSAAVSSAAAPSAVAASTVAASAASGTPPCRDKEQATARQQEQTEAKQQDKEADQQAAQQDRQSAADGPEDSAETEQSEDGAGDAESQGAEGEREDGAGRQNGSAPEALDKSMAEPGEKDRTAGDLDGRSGKGDPENEEDADDEPLGLQEESGDLDEDGGQGAEEDEGLGAEGEADSDATAGVGEDGLSQGDLGGSTPSAAQQSNGNSSAAGKGDGAPGVLDSPADRGQSDAAVREADGESGGAGAGGASSEEEQESDERLSQDLQSDKSIEQEIGPEPDESADDRVGEASGEESGEKGAGAEDADGAEAEKELAEERKEDAEAKRRDEEARTASAGTSGPAPGAGGDTVAPGRLSKADEDARKQAVSTSSESSASSSGSGSGSASGSGSGSGSASGDAKSADGSGAKDTAPSGGTGAHSGSGTGAGTAAGSGSGTETGPTAGSAAGRSEDRAASGTTSSGSEKPKDNPSDGAATTTKDTTGPKDTSWPSGATEGKDAAEAPAAAETKDVTEGKGPATTPGSDAGPERVSATGPANAPKLAPGKGAGGSAAAVANAAAGAPKAEQSAKPGPGKPTARPKAGATPRQRQAARQAAKNVRRGGGGGGGGGGRTAPAPARGGRGGGGRAASGAAKPKKDAPAPDVSKSTPEAGLAAVSRLKPYQMLETFKGVDGAVGNSVGKERTALRKGPPKMARPTGSPRTVPGGPTPAAPGTYTNAKVARTDAAKGRTPDINGEQRPEGEPPGADVEEPSWWDILMAIGGALLKKIFPFDDLIDSIMDLPTSDEGLKGNRVGDAPGVPLQDDSDPQRTDEQAQKLDERKNELHQSGREDAGRPMGEDQIYPDVPPETLTGKVPGGGGKKAGQRGGGAGKGPGGGVPIESASAVAEHDHGPEIQAGFAQGQKKMGEERKAKDQRAKDDRQQHDQDLKREVDASGKKQAGERAKGQSEIADSRDKWRKEQDDKVAEVDDKKGKKYDKVRKDVNDKQEQTDKDVDKRTEDDNKKIDDEHAGAQKDAEQKQEDKKKEAEKGDGGFLDELKQWWENLKNDIKKFFERARKAVTDLIDKFKREVFQLIDDVRNWVVQQINDFADALIAFGDEMLADYPAMRDKWRNTINAGRDYAVRKVNEAADALKDVAGKLLDGLCSALTAGLDLLEGGLLAAVDVAENVTVKAVEVGQAVVSALGEWAAIFNDIVSDPGGWIDKAGSAAHTGAKDYLFDEVKSAVKEWFNQKVQEITGLAPEDFQALIEGNVSVEEMGKMAWDAAVPQLPLIIGELVIEKVVAKLIPGAGWVMAIIDALKTAWDTLSEILAAFGLFMDFLKAVKSGNAARPFAKAVAAGVVALLELIYQALIDGLNKYMGKVTSKLGEMLKNIRGKRRPGGHGGPGEPGAPGSPGQNGRPGQSSTPDQSGRPGHPNSPAHADKPGPTADKPGPTDKPDQRPAPRKPSPDKTSRPETGPRPGKHPSPEKKPHPTHQPTPKSKKKPDAHERRDDGNEVNAARRRARAAKDKLRRDDKTGPTKPRRGPARDTLRKNNRPDKDKSKDPLHKKDPNKPDLKKPDRSKDKKNDPKKHPRRPESRTRSKLRRARQTIKSALSRSRRAARRLLGKGRKLTHKLNNRAHRLRNQWRRQRDRLRRNHDRKRDKRREKGKDGPYKYDMPKVHFRQENGEVHTLMYRGRGSNAGLVVRSDPAAIREYLDKWRMDIESILDTPNGRNQAAFIEQAEDALRLVKEEQRELPPIGATERSITSRQRTAHVRLRRQLNRLAEMLAQREKDPKPPLLNTFIPNFDDGVRGSSFEATGINMNPPKGEISTKAKPGNPLGWDTLPPVPTRWVRMHLLTEKLGGPARGANLVPAPGPEVNTKFHYRLEGPSYNAVAVTKSEDMIWYKVDVSFHSNNPADQNYPYPKSIGMKWGGYDVKNRRWVKKPTRMSYERDNIEIPGHGDTRFNINGRSPARIRDKFKVTETFAKAVVLQSPFRNFRILRLKMTKYKRGLPSNQMRDFTVDIQKLEARQNELRYN
ncbi:DUF4157 domain-containing protein [Streptomyces inhibens]|uniref:DUF4157 domain-containing protein n=1 Tax=Streptomyces inhibens TaxID=2293571 RepID=A0A371PYX2_STRIH|nr:DUF4157 domain-containing protein [Streptomyces inhibens]REK87655.1 DUF4157 domain-containing protein [Streptomyces inhibens]